MQSQLEQKARIRNSIWIALITSVLMVLFFLYFIPINWAMMDGAFLGLFMGASAYGFQNNKLIEKQTLPDIIDPERLVYYGGANHFLNREGVGGRLFLLDTEMVFRSHKFNIQNHELSIKIQDIEKVDYYNLAGFVPNGLYIQLKSGKIESFVVNNRLVWKSMIENRIQHEIALITQFPVLGS